MDLFKNKKKKGLKELFRKKGKLEKLYYKNKEFINYSIVSVVCTFILYLLYFVVDYITHGRYILANLVAYIVSFTILYLWDQKIFKSRPSKSKERIYQITIFIIFRVIGFALDSAILVFLIERLKASNMLSKVMSSLITFVFNYATNKLFVFKERKL